MLEHCRWCDALRCEHRHPEHPVAREARMPLPSYLRYEPPYRRVWEEVRSVLPIPGEVGECLP